MGDALPILVLGRSGQMARSLADVAAGPAGAGLALEFAGRDRINLRDPGAIARLVAATPARVVVNTAAYTAVDLAEEQEAEATVLNDVAPFLLAKACRARHLGLIHLSSDYVFDGEKDGPYVESDAPRPINAYGRSKLAGEKAVLAADPGALVLRTSWIFGPFGRNFMKTVLDHARDRGRLRIVADQVGTPTCSLDLARIILELCRRIAAGTAPGGLYHAAGSGTASWHALASEIVSRSKEAGGPPAVVEAIPTTEYPTPARRPKNSALASARLAETFGLVLPDWRSGVTGCLERLDALGRERQG